MSHNYYNPTPLAVGEVPTDMGRVVPYISEDGDWYLGVLDGLGAKHEDSRNGTYYDAAVGIYKPKREGEASVGNPSSVEHGFWRYYPSLKLKDGRTVAAATWCPCGPGVPDHPCP